MDSLDFHEISHLFLFFFRWTTDGQFFRSTDVVVIRSANWAGLQRGSISDIFPLLASYAERGGYCLRSVRLSVCLPALKNWKS